jgi:DNA-binding PadR family transcriptional regulator
MALPLINGINSAAPLTAPEAVLQDSFEFPKPGLIKTIVTDDAPSHVKKPKRKNKSKPTTGITERGYQVLRIVYVHGWCTSKMVRQIASFHGVQWTDSANRAHQLLRGLEKSGFIVARKVGIGTRTTAYALTERGRRYIASEGDALSCEANAVKDPASPSHFLRLNEIMIKLRELYAAKLWLTDFEVRSENRAVGRNRLASDYDSVVELGLRLSDGRVRVAIEYVHSTQCVGRHAQSGSILATEQRLHIVLFVVADARLRNLLMGYLKNPSGFAFFLDFRTLMDDGDEAAVYYWEEPRKRHPCDARSRTGIRP